MSGISFQVGRTSNLSVSTSLLRTVQGTLKELADVQNQVSTGKLYQRPSDGAQSVSAILKLQQSIQSREQSDLNLDSAQAVLDNVDQALSDANTTILEARNTVLSQLGVTSDAKTRETMAVTIDANLEALIQIANRQYNGISLFGGNNGAADGGVVFESFLGGIRYTGGDEDLEADSGSIFDFSFTSNGVSAFGSLSSRVKTEQDYDPQAAAETSLNDLEGATGVGIVRGDVTLSVDGDAVTVDLGDADTMQDVVDRMNNAIDNIDPTAGALSIGASGFVLTAAVGHTITIDDTSNGQTAETMDLVLSSTGGVADTGADLGVKLTASTQLDDLGATIDWNSGLEITQGAVTETVDFSDAETIEDVINAVEALGLGVRVEINDDANGLDFVSEVSGIALSIGENGGTTASDLGVRTMDVTTELSDVRDGLGVDIVEGESDFRVTLHDGTSFDVDLTGSTTIGDVVDAIENAATTAGLTLGTDITVGMATTGNGLVIEDGTAGGENFRVQALGTSLAAEHLNLVQNAGAGTSIDTGDQSKVWVDSAFTHLQQIADSLRTNDTTGMTVAGEKLEDDLVQVTLAQAQVGVRSNAIEAQIERNANLTLTEQTLLSQLEDADMTEAITNFTLLQQQLEASMQVGASRFELSLLDFLR